MSVNINDLIIQEKDRIFIDVAYRGCGSGCKYCYVNSAHLEQELASFSDLGKLCDFLSSKDLDESRIISFCPNTEPFKSQESAERVLFLIDHLSRAGRYFQISTKEKIHDEIFEKLGECRKSPVFLNISIPTLQSDKYEPNAAPVPLRLENIENAKRFSNIYCGLYIKPLLKTLSNEIDQYLSIIKKYNPHYVCIGAHFNKEWEKPCNSLYHDETAKYVLQKQHDVLLGFLAKVKSATQCLTVCSTVCAIYKIIDIKCDLQLWKYQTAFCNQCKAKEGI